MPGPSSGEIAMAATMGAIGKSCLDLGGVVIEASQDRDLGALMRRDARTKDGVCKALSLVWIGKHAKEESFWDWLGTQGAIRWLNAQSIMATFISYGTHLAAYTGGDGDAWKDKWATDVLKPYAVIPYTGITGKVPPRIAGTLYPLGNICDAVVGYTDIYLQVSLGGTAGRHAVAFYTGFKDCSFYDPNYGEYWFPDKTKLKRWFSTFLRASTYDKVLGADYVIRRYKTG